VGSVVERARRLTLEVVDNGPGFARKPQAESRRTFGLGLIETIVEQYDGTLCIDREREIGAKVSVSLLLRHP
jgi:two-component sensor histidine kinase